MVAFIAILVVAIVVFVAISVVTFINIPSSLFSQAHNNEYHWG